MTWHGNTYQDSILFTTHQVSRLHTYTHTHCSSQHPAFPALAVSASLASVSLRECLTGSQALAFSSASLSSGSDSLSFSLEPIQRLKWLPFSHGIEAFFPLSPCISSLPLSINQSVSLPLSVFHLFFLAVFHWNPLRYTFTGPIFYQLGFAEAHKSPCWCRITWCMYMHSSKACDTIAGYSFAHFSLIRAVQHWQSVPCNLRFLRSWQLAFFSSGINRELFSFSLCMYKGEQLLITIFLF